MTRHFLTVFLLIALLVAGPLRASAQPVGNGGAPTCLRAIYRIDYKLDSAVAMPKSELMILRISNGISCFRHRSEHIRDSIYTSLSYLPQNERGKPGNDAWLKAGKTEIYYFLYKEPAKGLVFYHDGIGSVDHQYQEKASLFHWKIMPTRKVVAGYECQQAYTAFGGRTWEAWFTRDSPVSEGPYKFYGLPGLIVKVRDTHDNYVFELLSFESNPKPFTISVTSPAPLINKAKFKQAKLNDDLTFLDRLAAHGNKFPEDMRNRYVERIKRRNNPLELK